MGAQAAASARSVDMAMAVNATSEMNPTLAKKLRKLLEMRVDTPAITAALTDISTFYESNTIGNRRGLRAELERRGVGLHTQMLEAFEPVASSLTKLDESVDELSSACKAIQGRLRKVRHENSALLEASESMQEKRDTLSAKRAVVTDFFGKIFLKPDETAALVEGPSGEGFFGALEHLQQIQHNNEVLLRVAHQRAGLEIMDQMSNQLEAAFELLYRWTVEQFQQLSAADSGAAEGKVKRALLALRGRPALLVICFDEFITARKSVLLRQFLEALTIGGRGGMPRPIDLLAHEPTRFVGDMLAWVYEALAVEHDLVNALVEAEPAAAAGAGSAVSHSVPSVIGTLLIELCAPLKTRLQQVLSSQSSVILCFQVSNVVDFYVHTIQTKCVGGQEQQPALTELTSVCQQSFQTALQAHLDKLLRQPPPPNSDLTPAHSIAEVISWVEQMAEVCSSSLVPDEHRFLGFDAILRSIMDPLIRACVLSSQTRGTTDGAIFMLNAVCLLLSALAGHHFAKQSSEELQQRVDTLCNTIIDDQAAAVLRTGNLGEKIRMISSAPAGQQLASTVGLEAGVLMDSVRKLYHSVFGGQVVLIPQCDRIQVLRYRNQVRSAVLARIVAGYTVLYNAVATGGYEDASVITPHSPEQFSTLLQ